MGVSNREATLPNQTGSLDFALAIDIGGTKVAFAFVDTSGKELMPSESHPVPFDDAHRAIPEKIVDLIRPYVERAKTIPGNFLGIGYSNCGNVDTKTGMATLVANLGWRYVPIGQMIKDAFGLPVYAATDVRMALVGELVWGAAKGLKYVAWATDGTGYGGYLFLDGRLIDGTHGFAGPFGHNTLDEKNGYPCGCGRKGCVETFVSGPGIARAGQKAAENGESIALAAIIKERPVTTRDVFAAEAAGDAGAHAVIEEVIRLLSISLSGLVNTLDLDMIIFGGGVTHASPDFVERVDRRIRDFLMSEEAIRDLRVIRETHKNSCLIGAAAEVFVQQGILTL
jgi:glucokinase